MAQPSAIVQPDNKRTQNFQEVSLGYSKRIAADESVRCPQCPQAPCVTGCPLGIDIPGFIRLLREGKIQESLNVIRESNPLPSVCGRICSAPCEKVCVLHDEGSAIGIRALERYVAENGRFRVTKQSANKDQIAIVGSGPSGLSAAYVLAQDGYRVTVFDSLNQPGGILRYGIPEFRVPKRILDSEVRDLRAMGVNFEMNCFIGQTRSLDDLMKDGYSAVLLATGAGIPKFMNLKGANLGGVYYGEEFLMRVNLQKANRFAKSKPDFPLGQNVAVIGSGNTALDCARAACRYGRNVSLIFRRTQDDMRVRNEERLYAQEEGVRFEPLVRPVEIVGGEAGFVSHLRCVRMDFAQVPGTDAWDLQELPDSEFNIEADSVIIAIGHTPNTLLKTFDDRLNVCDDGTVWINESTGMTSISGVFACGNVVTNAGPVVEAIADGKRAAQKMMAYCDQKRDGNRDG